jgi:hypothetical protein
VSAKALRQTLNAFERSSRMTPPPPATAQVGDDGVGGVVAGRAGDAAAGVGA